MKRWSSNIEDWTLLSEQSANLLINQAESRLKATEETSFIITSSNDRLIGFATSLISISLGYLFAGDQIYLKSVAFFALINCLIAFYYLARNLSKYEIFTLGEEPRIIFNNSFINSIYNPEQQFINLSFQILETIQFKIDQNHKVNNLRQSRVMKAKNILLFIPISFLLGALCNYLLGYQLTWAN